MINKLISWIKSHKLVICLAAIIVWLVWSNRPANMLVSRSSSSYGGISASKIVDSAGLVAIAPQPFESGVTANEAMMAYDSQAETATSRLVIQSSNLSLLVKDVITSKDSVIAKAEEVGGWMVTSSLSQPEESPFAYVTISVPSDQINPVLTYLRGLSIKVVSENLTGRDVTDQYTDIEEHIAILEETKSRYEEIRTQTIKIDDLLTVTRELINIQNQIDSYQGQLQKIEQQTAMSQISVYLSTDEMALPYAPDQTFRPGVIFKLAVRSLVGFLYGLANVAIWVGVFAIVWVPVLLIIRWWKKRKQLRR